MFSKALQKEVLAAQLLEYASCELVANIRCATGRTTGCARCWWRASVVGPGAKMLRRHAPKLEQAGAAMVSLQACHEEIVRR